MELKLLHQITLLILKSIKYQRITLSRINTIEIENTFETSFFFFGKFKRIEYSIIRFV